MPGQSLWVQGITPADARLAASGLLATNSSDPGDIRQGVIYNGQQTLLNATSGLSVTVPASHFVCSKAYSNGAYLGFNPSTATVTVPAAPTIGLKRIDVLYVVQQDAGALVSADGTTTAVFGVHPGIASPTPLKPALTDAPAAPVGAIEVGTITWDSTSSVPTATNASGAGASCTLATTCLWTATRADPVAVRSQAERDATLTPFDGLQVYRLDTHLVETYNGTVWLGGAWLTYTPTLSGFTIGNGTLAGYYTIIGKTVHYEIRVTMGSTSNITSNMGASLPVPPSRVNRPGGQVRLTHGASTQQWSSWVFPSGSLVFPENATGGLATISTPWGWASGDTWIIAGTYEAA